MPPTPREVWERIHAEYGKYLGCPCRLQFSEDVITASHRFDDDFGCVITVNPTLEFLRPEHLILHEFAHHRNITPIIELHGDEEEGTLDMLSVESDQRSCCIYGGHCEHWAQTLLDMYRETSTKLPYTTMFEKFAEVAKIKFKVFERFNVRAWSK
jgi:hypothetical protein